MRREVERMNHPIMQPEPGGLRGFHPTPFVLSHIGEMQK